MYLLLNITEQVILKYPYSIAQLREDNPQVSFPKNPTPNLLKEYNTYPVQQTEPPIVDYTKNISESTPELIEGVWTQAWLVTEASPEEIHQRVGDQWNLIRKQRNRLLTECDWTQLPDAPVEPTVWSVYRQALRDITLQEDPFNIVWPEKP
jgi:hypothetical protein